MSIQSIPPGPPTTAGQLAARATQNDQILANALAELEDRASDLESRSGTYALRNQVNAQVAALNARLDEGVSVSDNETASMIATSGSATHQAVAQIALEANSGLVQHPDHPGLYQIVQVP